MERSSEVSSFDAASRQQLEGRLRLQRALRGIAYASLTCIFTLGGAIVGSVTGALKGQTTETGLFRGAGIGAVAGAVVSVELMESLIQGDILSKITLFASLMNGKIFREWVSPAMLKAYQWQISTLDQVNDRRELSDIFDVSSNDKAMSAQSINRLPEFDIQMLMMTTDICGSTVTCSVCLQDFRVGERCRRLPSCNHYFHKLCIDMWLLKHGSCPICRRGVGIGYNI